MKQKRNQRLPEPRWTVEETKAVEKAAKKRGLTVTAYIRYAALAVSQAN